METTILEMCKILGYTVKGDENNIGSEYPSKVEKVENLVYAGSGTLVVDFGFETKASRFRRALVHNEQTGYFDLIYCS